MSRIARPLTPLALVFTVLAACGSSGSPAPTAATAPTATPTAPPVTATASTVPSPASAAPSASPVISKPPADPMEPARVTGTFAATVCCPMSLTLTATDTRVSGMGFFDLHSTESQDGTMAWEWGDFALGNADGGWDGSCSGGGWVGSGTSKRAEVSCWLTGHGAYDGLSYFQHLSATARSGELYAGSGELYGLILPLPVPTL